MPTNLLTGTLGNMPPAGGIWVRMSGYSHFVLMLHREISAGSPPESGSCGTAGNYLTA